MLCTGREEKALDGQAEMYTGPPRMCRRVHVCASPELRWCHLTSLSGPAPPPTPGACSMGGRSRPQAWGELGGGASMTHAVDTDRPCHPLPIPRAPRHHYVCRRFVQPEPAGSGTGHTSVHWAPKKTAHARAHGHGCTWRIC